MALISLILHGFSLLYVLQDTPIVKFPLIQYLNRTITEAYGNLPLQENNNNNTSGGFTIYEYLDSINYPYESHYVTTEDGYILNVHRLIGSPNTSNYTRNWKHKPVVLIQHGLESSSFDWILKGPQNSLPLILADAGWDVWLGNNRGNRYSRNHTTLDPDVDLDFWNFSFDECGNYDVPAMIDYIQNKTGRNKVFYVGHSQGTSQYFAFAALRPNYNDKIALATALAPVVYMSHMTAPLLKFVCQFLDTLSPLVDLLKLHEVKGITPEDSDNLKNFCGANPDICFMVSSFSSGFNRAQNDESIISKFVYSFPSGNSFRMLLHYGQEINSGYFRRFDYGKAGNLDKYKMPYPPNYNLSAVTSPVALFYSENDFMSAVVDVQRLIAELPNIKHISLNSDRFFNHLNYIVAKDVNDLLYIEVMDLMTTYAIKYDEEDDSDDNSDGRGNSINLSTSALTVVAVVCYITNKN